MLYPTKIPQFNSQKGLFADTLTSSKCKVLAQLAMQKIYFGDLPPQK